MEKQIIRLTNKDCQASFDWKFIDEIELVSKTDTEILSKADLCLGNDVYIERDLGHYSSGLLLEIFKQLSKGTVVHCLKLPDEVRYVVADIQMDFSRYTILDTQFPVAVYCKITDIDRQSDDVVSGVTAIVEFKQGSEISSTIKSHVKIMSAKKEAKFEGRIRMGLKEYYSLNACK